MKTKDLILLKALELFNEHSASAISNNRIAAEMGISPGNLHYHFRTKEAVIRAIYYILFEKMDNLWYEPSFYGSEDGIVDYFYKLSGLLYEYRFCYRELNVLLKNDPVLKEEYAARNSRILKQMEQLYHSYVEAGIMKSINSENDRSYIIENTWIIGLMWITYADILYKDVTSSIIHESVYHLYYNMKPYLTAKADRKIEEAILGNKKRDLLSTKNIK